LGILLGTGEKDGDRPQLCPLKIFLFVLVLKRGHRYAAAKLQSRVIFVEIKVVRIALSRIAETYFPKINE
jgi:hypothetical protein